MISNPFVQDLLDVLRLRIRPLSHYVYPYWQLAVLIGMVALAHTAVTPPPAALLVPSLLRSVVSIMVALLAQVLFFGWWLSLGQRWKDKGQLLNLFSLMALTEGVIFLTPLTVWLPQNVGAVLWFVIVLFQKLVLLIALSRSTQVALSHVLVGMLLAKGLAVLLGMIALAG